MHIFTSPSWIKEFEFHYENIEDIPQQVVDSINNRLNKIIGEKPLVSILISAWNEEVNILRTIASLSKLEVDFPIEIIVVNNNSTDKTQNVLDKLTIKSFFQPIQGWGPARQMGLENASGKYILLADADCLYPSCWATKMLNVLTKPGVVCVYGRYSFIPEKDYPRWKLFILETMKDCIAEVRQLKRPYLNTFGISMGYIREYGLKVGYVMHKIRGEDGRLSFDLMQFGKIKQVRSNAARAWTAPRTIQRDGSMSKAILTRVKKEIKRFFSMFSPHPPHDTKNSKNN